MTNVQSVIAASCRRPLRANATRSPSRVRDDNRPFPLPSSKTLELAIQVEINQLHETMFALSDDALTEKRLRSSPSPGCFHCRGETRALLVSSDDKFSFALSKAINSSRRSTLSTSAETMPRHGSRHRLPDAAISSSAPSSRRSMQNAILDGGRLVMLHPFA